MFLWISRGLWFLQQRLAQEQSGAGALSGLAARQQMQGFKILSLPCEDAVVDTSFPWARGRQRSSRSIFGERLVARMNTKNITEDAPALGDETSFFRMMQQATGEEKLKRKTFAFYFQAS